MHSHNAAHRTISMGVYIIPCTDNHFFLLLVCVCNELNLIAISLTQMVIYITNTTKRILFTNNDNNIDTRLLEN